MFKGGVAPSSTWETNGAATALRNEFKSQISKSPIVRKAEKASQEDETSRLKAMEEKRFPLRPREDKHLPRKETSASA
jgi:hypothetical protein